MILDIHDLGTGAVLYSGRVPHSSDALTEFRRALRVTRARFPDARLGHNVPVVAHLDAKILARVERAPRLFDMRDWHGSRRREEWCRTAHCRAGWAEVIALEETGTRLQLLPGNAGPLIYAASRPETPVPDFFASRQEALEDLRRCAALDPLPVAEGRPGTACDEGSRDEPPPGLTAERYVATPKVDELVS